MTSAIDLCLPGLVKSAIQTRAKVIAHEVMAKNTWRLRVECPDIARRILPGQFFMIRLPERSDPLLGRPFALFDIYLDSNQSPAGIDFGYVVVGKMTSLLESLRVGDDIEIWGPLGNGFPPPPSGHLVIVSGGIGITPFLAVVREALGKHDYGYPERILSTRPSQITLCHGVRSSEYLGGVDAFQNEGINIRIATDDGSVGHRGFVTDLLREALSQDTQSTVYCCGPEPMMHAVARLCAKAQVPCFLSLETPMACGFGACFSCVTKVKQDDGSVDYRRVCVEGPVFPANTLALD